MSNLRQFIGAQQGTYVTGARYPTMPPRGILANSAGAGSKNGVIFFSPFQVMKTHTFTGYAFFVGTTGGNIRIGLFTDMAAGGVVGSAVIAGSDTTSIAVGGSAAEQTIAASMTLAPGIYWCGYELSSGSAVLKGLTLSNDGYQQVGFDITGSIDGTFPQITQAFGAFPNPVGSLDAGGAWALTAWPIHLIA